ncbi:MAG TPA: ATP-binding protein [Stellaceae bacterium]|nr:ATP-binding protein [Stellaceae bacterium]
MTQGSEIAGSGRIGTNRPLRALMVAVVVVPLALFCGAAWLIYLTIFDEARTRVLNATDAINQHAQKVFETAELILGQVAERVDNMDWTEIADSPNLHRMLQDLGNRPRVAVVGLVGPDGTVAASNLAFPASPVRLAERTWLTVDRPGLGPLMIGSVARGAYTGKPEFIVARYKPGAPQSGLANLIFVSLQLTNFVSYSQTVIDSEEFLLNMSRADGAVLVRFPGEELAGRVLGSNSQFRLSIAKNPEQGSYETRSELDGVRRLFTYRKVSDYPVYVSVGLARSAVVSQWLHLMGSHLIFGVPAMLSLVALTYLALRRSEAADRATAAFRTETERRKVVEDSLRHAQRMEAIGQMTGGVAHDFNNLMTVVTGNLDMILRGPGDAARVKRLAEAALRATMRGERLTHQLLMFSRREVMRPETLNLNRLLLEFDGLMRRAVGETAGVQLNLDPGLDPSYVDQVQFEAAVLNLIVNARDALADGGTIVIETRNVVLDEAYAAENPEVKPGPYILVAVSDKGAGIADTDLPRVFEPFFTTKEVGRGSGLGLSQVYGFAKESGGHIKIYSELGIGTTVKLYLPRSTQRPTDSIRRDTVPLRTATGGETVLVVEDDEAVLATAVESLGDLGYRVLVAHNGPEALEIVKGPEKIEILFSDIVMPGGINGAELAAAARRLRPSIKVLLTSGYTGAALATEHGLPADMPVLGKPYRRDELAAQLRVIIGGQAR